MLFNSAIYLFAFLPIAVLVYHLLRRAGQASAAKLWLVAASLYFYSFWKLEYLPLLLGSIAVNYAVGSALTRMATRKPGSKQQLLLLGCGIAFNLGLLGYFKYADFFLSISNDLVGTDFGALNLLLPLAISFFTFQQIAYLVDCHRGIAHEYSLLNYSLFVSFFPQLIAGPIVHHRQMMPQFERFPFQGEQLQRDFTKGLYIFSLGLFKKVCIADTFAAYADVGFAQSSLTTTEAWMTSLSYTFQLYYDFSGYSDMAIGAALLFGIRLPLNFFSPYRATSIREFWRRWHITLSHWLRDYLYIPLGGNRRGLSLTCRNLLITFVIGGLWHGAGWTFLLWGALHGAALVVHKLWTEAGLRLPTLLAWGLTFLFVNTTWVFFRADDIASALAIIGAMFSVDQVAMDGGYIYQVLASRDNPLFASLVTALNTGVIWAMPLVLALTVYCRNTIELSAYREDATVPGYGRITVAAVGFALAAILILSGSPRVFLYFNF